jgi:poly-beta-1,6-N-acetyl-D-glucosamine synthase
MKNEPVRSSVSESAVKHAELPTYVLITPARNEEASVEKTIKSVISQTVKPLKWVIVSDGSTDSTDDIVKQYLPIYPWLALIRMPERKERHFAGKVMAFNAGYNKVKHLNYDIIGNLDADMSFDPEHFGFLLSKFVQYPDLGVAGSAFRERDSEISHYNYKVMRKEHVSGGCQLFRRECYESIGGYMPLKGGGVDLTAVVTARMKGWRTETFPEMISVHHRQMGTAQDNVLRSIFKSGYGDYRMGVHPVWQVFRSFYQLTKQPLILGGAMLMLGYFWGMLKNVQKPVSKEFVKFRRREQLKWLNEYFKILVRCG